ncbi:hypothetical protein GGI15_004740 [Coemansia interrupta]|uniref:DUF788-domain-containing protein n=1 Tax=Coemansia interrupta TaxID=1126814 RepID=A0A9W8H1D0_9FUNG|nr:hypothetical protein GGI15_004740 [Coemansia interrupta]
MAKQSAKRIAQENAARLALMSKLLVGVNGFYLVIRLFFQYSTLGWGETLMYLVTLLIELLLYRSLYMTSRPRYDTTGALVDAGTDLSQPGLVSYMFDYIYISWFVHLLSLVTRWAWMVYLAIPAYLAVAFGPSAMRFLGIGQGSGGRQEQGEVTEEDAAREKKRREKKERKQQRVKYARG